MAAPKVGDVVWFTPASWDRLHKFAPLAAIVAYVHTERCVNLAVIKPDGTTCPAPSIPLLQPLDTRPDCGFYCEQR